VFHIEHHLVFAIRLLFPITPLALVPPEIFRGLTITLKIFPKTLTSMHTQIQMLKRDTSRPPNLETMVCDDQDLHVQEPPDSFVFRVPENILQVWHCDNQLGFLLQFNINHKIDQNKPKKPNS
jgi:hypothetical protein